MTLDDRSLREHLDRRAEAGLTDIAQTADVVLARVAEIGRDPWWRRLPVRGPSLGIAAATFAVVVIALAVLPSRLWPGPGASPTSSAPAMASGYPATRALTGAELASLLGKDPVGIVGVTLVADVAVSSNTASCVRLALCPEYIVDAPGRTIATRPLWAYRSRQPLLDPPYAFRVREDGHLDLLGSVQPGPDGLPWTLAGAADVMAGARAADRAVPYLYLVDAVRATSTALIECPFVPAPSIGPDLSCAAGTAWLVPDESFVPGDGFPTAPVNSVRIPASKVVPGRSDALQQRGFWLVDPFVDQEGCFACPPAGAVDLVGRVLTLDELGLPSPETPAASTAPPTAEPSPTAEGSAPSVDEVAFSTESMTLAGFETADLIVTITFSGDVVYPGADRSQAAQVCLTRESSGSSDPRPVQRIRGLIRIDGTQAASATFRMTPSDHGTWRLTCIIAVDGDGRGVTIDPVLAGGWPEIEVTGTHPPHLTLELDPYPAEIGQAVTVSGQVTDEDTGDRLARVVVAIATNGTCAQGGTGEIVTTDAIGTYSYELAVVQTDLVCAWISDTQGVYVPDSYQTEPVAVFAYVLADATGP